MGVNKKKQIVKSVFKNPEELNKKSFTAMWAKMINTIEKNKI